MKIFTLSALCLVMSAPVFSQLMIEKHAVLHLQNKAELYVAGDITSEEPVIGEGTIILNDLSQQKINFMGNQLNRLVVQNPGEILLTGDITVDKSLHLEKGNLNASEQVII